MLEFKLGCYKSYPLQESRPEILGWLAKRFGYVFINSSSFFWQVLRKDIRAFRHYANIIRGSSLHLMRNTRRLCITDCHLLAIRC